MSDIGLTVRWNNSVSSESLKNDRKVYLNGNHFIGRWVPSWCLTHYTLLESGKDYYILKQFQDDLSGKVKLAVFLNFWHIRIDMTHCVTLAIADCRWLQVWCNNIYISNGDKNLYWRSIDLKCCSVTSSAISFTIKKELFMLIYSC